MPLPPSALLLCRSSARLAILRPARISRPVTPQHRLQASGHAIFFHHQAVLNMASSSSPAKIPDSEWSIAASMPEELEDLEELEADAVQTSDGKRRKRLPEQDEQDEQEPVSKKLKSEGDLTRDIKKTDASPDVVPSPAKSPSAKSSASQSSPAKVHVKKQIFMPGFGPSTSPSPTANNPALKKALKHDLPSASTQKEEIARLKREFIDSLPADLRELTELEQETMGDDWFVALRGEFVKPYFRELKTFLKQEQATKKVFPPAQDIYSWSRLCPLAKIRVVIIGQDPYHNDGQAHGLAFSVRRGVAVPPSLKNMYKELETDVPGFKAPKHGDLTSWAEQGVLLLNTALTVRAHEAASHSKKGWDQFTNAVLNTIRERLSPAGAEQGAQGVVFLAWGAHAGKLTAAINQRQHCVLKAVHPSPLSASRGFFGCKHFSKCNQWLEEHYGPESRIAWESVVAS